MTDFQQLLGSPETIPARFGTCLDRADYRRQTGQEPPPFDPNKPLKFWWDKDAYTDADGLPEIVYANNVMTKTDGTWALRSGVPVTKPLVLAVEDAANVNLPPEDPSGSTVVPAGIKSIPCPFRDLLPDESLAVAGAEAGFLSGKVLVIRNNKKFAEAQARAAEDSGRFTSDDRARLRAVADRLAAIAERLGV